MGFAMLLRRNVNYSCPLLYGSRSESFVVPGRYQGITLSNVGSLGQDL